MVNPIQPVRLQSMLMETSEEDLIQDFENSPAAFDQMYRKYLDPVYRYLYLRVSSAPEAEDLTSQVFLAALEGLPRYRPQGHFAAWLFSIARRKVADYYRSRLPSLPLDPDSSDLPSSEADPLTQLILKDELHSLVRQIGHLPEDERELLRLRFAARLSFDELAQVLNRKPSAVKMAIYRLLERLETRLEADRE